jgi:hypothetical protein
VVTHEASNQVNTDVDIEPGTPHGLAGSGWITIDKSNVGQYPF